MIEGSTPNTRCCGGASRAIPSRSGRWSASVAARRRMARCAQQVATGAKTVRSCSWGHRTGALDGRTRPSARVEIRFSVASWMWHGFQASPQHAQTSHSPSPDFTRQASARDCCSMRKDQDLSAKQPEEEPLSPCARTKHHPRCRSTQIAARPGRARAVGNRGRPRPLR